MILLGTHTIYFGWEIRKIIFWYEILSGGLLNRTWLRVITTFIHFGQWQMHIVIKKEYLWLKYLQIGLKWIKMEGQNRILSP